MSLGDKYRDNARKRKEANEKNEKAILYETLKNIIRYVTKSINEGGVEITYNISGDFSCSEHIKMLEKWFKRNKINYEIHTPIGNISDYIKIVE